MDNYQVFKPIIDAFGIVGWVLLVLFIVIGFVGKRLIDGFLAAMIEKVSLHKQKEIEIFKYKVSLDLNKIGKISEKEFEILPMLWTKLNHAMGSISSYLAPFQSHPDIDRMEPDEIERIMDRYELLPSKKNIIMNSNRKTATLIEIIQPMKFGKIFDLFYDFHNYLIENKIFLEEHLKEKFLEIDDVLYSALSAREEAESSNDFKLRSKAYRNMQDKVSVLMVDIE